jgi:hypothetical protein
MLAVLQQCIYDLQTTDVDAVDADEVGLAPVPMEEEGRMTSIYYFFCERVSASPEEGKV